MKFINSGDKHSEFDYLDFAPPHTEETSKTRWIPSYYAVIKKHQRSTMQADKKQ